MRHTYQIFTFFYYAFSILQRLQIIFRYYKTQQIRIEMGMPYRLNIQMYAWLELYTFLSILDAHRSVVLMVVWFFIIEST